MEANALVKENLSKQTTLSTTTTIDSILKNEKQGGNTLAEFSAFDATKEVNPSGKFNKNVISKASVNFEEKLKIEPDVEISELLGSVITHNCPGVRTSARVIQKMKQDQIRPTTPPPIERDHKQKDEKLVQKTPSQLRTNKPIWTNLERNHFFDAVNEFGKDFEAIGNYINSKLRRKCGTDISFKTKEQVRLHYYQTFHKICKYIRFSDEVKKPAQELYALINYGEMRRKLQFVTDKHFIKLRHLVYQGQIIVRCKGKNIRIKTPSCKALRRLNQLDDSLEDIRLPSKIEVVVTPANMEAFGRVQTIAQNPRARITVPLQKKLINFIKTFQHKWRSADVKFAEEEARLFPYAGAAGSVGSEQTPHSTEGQQNEKTAAVSAIYQDPEMCFLPKPGVTIHRPLLSITQYLSSVNICLSAYEERMGVKVRGETLCVERPNNKRQRTESGSDKRSPDTKKQKNCTSGEKSDLAINSVSVLNSINIKLESQNSNGELSLLKNENTTVDYSIEDLNVELNELLTDVNSTSDDQVKALVETQVKSDPATPAAKNDCVGNNTINMNSLASINTTSSNTQIPTTVTITTSTQARSKRANASKARSALNFKPLISEDVIKRIRKGWTMSNAGDITIGDLYVVFGQDSRLEFHYFWTEMTNTTNITVSDTTNICNTQTDASSSVFLQKPNGVPYNPSECDDPNLTKTLMNSPLSNKLKHLLLIANLSERIRKRQCSCGHTCEKTIAKARIQQIERDLATRTFISNKTFLPNATSSDGNSLFRQPIVPIRRPGFNMDPIKQLPTVMRPKMSRQVLVQRLLLPGGMSHHDLVDVKNLQNNIIGLKQDKEKMMTSIQNTISHVNPLVTAFVRSKSLKPISASNLKLESSVIDSTSNCKDDTNRNDISSSYPHQRTLDLLSTKLSNEEENNGIYNEQTVEKSVKNVNEFSLSSVSDSAFDENSNASIFSNISPTHLIRESTSNSRWLEENLNDFSLTSLLGHLDEINASRDILDPSSNMSVISESSVDYMSKFQEITALMRNQDNE